MPQSPILTITLWITCIASLTLAAPPGQTSSGLSKGDEVSAWEPYHVAGPHAGTKTCPVCTYLEAPVLLAFAKDLAAAEDLAKPLEKIADAHSIGKLRVVLVVVDASDEDLRKLAEKDKFRRLMLCRPDFERRVKQLTAYKIDPAVTNTIMLYENYVVKQTWTSLAASDLHILNEACNPFLPKR